MPNRLLKETICTSENIDQLSSFQETFFYRLIVNCDDFGRIDARPKLLSSKLFPLKDIKTTQIEDALRALISAELVMLYEVGGKPYLQMNTWERHQQIRAKKSKFPAPDDAISDGVNCGHLIADDIKCDQMISDDSQCPRNPIQSESNPNPKENARKTRFAPPTVDQVREYCTERGNRIDAQHFVDFYASKGWRVGSSPMKDWKAAVRNWEQRDRSGYSGQTQKTNPALAYAQRRYTTEEANDVFADPSKY